MTATLGKTRPGARDESPGVSGRLRRLGPMTYVAWLVVALLVVLPLGVLLVSSISVGGLPVHLAVTVDNYLQVYTDGRLLKITWNSLVYGALSTVFAIIIGAGLAFLVERTDMPGKRVVGYLTLIPLAIPAVVQAATSVLILSPNVGMINNFIRLFGIESNATAYSMYGMVFTQCVHMVPLAYLLTLPSMRNMDATLEEAARLSGATSMTVMRTIIFPLVKPAILGVGTFCFIISCLSFDVPGMLGIPKGIYTFGTQLFLDARPAAGLPKLGKVSAMSASLLIVLLFLARYYQRTTRQAERFVLISGRVPSRRPVVLRLFKVPAIVAAWAYIAISTVIPVIVLALSSLLPYYQAVTPAALENVSLKNYKTFFSSPVIGTASFNSFFAALVTAVLVAAVSFLIAWVVVKRRPRWAAGLDSMAVIPVAVPGVVMGMCMIFLFLTFNPFNTYGSIWMIIVGSVVINLPFCVRVLSTALLQVHDDLGNAASISGATPATTLRSIIVPLSLPSIGVAIVWSATLVLRELALPLMVQSGHNPMFVTVLWGHWDGGEFNIACAGAVVLICALGILVAIWSLFERRSHITD